MAYLIVGINTMLIVIFFVTAEKHWNITGGCKMLTSLSSDKYQCGKSKPAFLLHSTGHLPAGSEIDASIIYADYYYMEALLRLKRLTENKPVIDE